MVQVEHKRHDLLLVELTQLEKEVSKVSLTTYDVNLNFWLKS